MTKPTQKMAPEALARHRLARAVHKPVKRLDALTRELRLRDLTTDELLAMAQAAEDARAAVRVLRTGGR